MVHFEQGIDMSLGGQSDIYAAQGGSKGAQELFNRLAAGDTSGGIPVDNSKYAQIMELMRRRNAMNNSTYTGGYGSLAAAAPTSASTYDELARLQRLNNPNLFTANERGSGDYATGDGYSPNVSPLSNPMTGSGLYGFLDAYGNALGGMLPLGLVAKTIAQSMNPGQIEQAGKLSSQALSDAIAGYTSGTMFGAPPSSASTFGGGGYGTPTSQGGYGVTGMTGAGIAANPMGIDPATARGQQAAAAIADAAASISGGREGGGVSAPSGGMSGYGGSAVAPGGTSSAPNQGPGYGFGPEGGGGGGGDGVGGGFGGNDGSGAGFGGIYSRGGYVNKKHLKGPNPMGPDDGYGGLDDGEFVINAKSVGKYGIDLMNAINNGKISKGKLRGLLEA